MAQNCDICGAEVGFLNKFRCQDGVICKKCYEIVSNHFATTITQMTLGELKRNYVKNVQPLDMGEGGFQATRKIGSFLLLDEKTQKVCILNNQKLTGRNTRPVIFPYSALKSFQLISQPQFSVEQLSALAADKTADTTIQGLSIRLYLTGNRTEEITIIPSSVRVSSFAFRRGLQIAKEILGCLADI
ncbi:MAG: DUF4428 domain-containing protein [Oscillibacter sp.]|jgi:hypothetical protein|nr:DUF4428 domain-containing protein [Oscillibacter sp.]